MHIARWAHMHCSLSVRLSICHTYKIHIILEGIMGRSLKLYMSAYGYGIIAVTGRAHCQHQVAFLILFTKILVVHIWTRVNKVLKLRF